MDLSKINFASTTINVFKYDCDFINFRKYDMQDILTNIAV